MITLIHKYYDQDGNYIIFGYEISKDRFYIDIAVEKYIILTFANYYDISEDVSEKIIENFDLWRDEGLLKELLERYMRELDKRFWDNNYLHRENKYKGWCLLNE